MANLEVFFLDNSFTGATCPSVTSVTFPYTFTTPVPVDIDLELTYTDGSHTYKRTITANGNMTGYSSNGIYPCVALSTVGYYSSYYQIGCAVNATTASFVGTSVVNYYKDDVLQNTQTYTNSLEGFIYCSGRTYEADSCKLRVIKCSLPIIFGEANNKSSDLYTERPDVYFYSNVSGTTRMPAINNGYDYDRVFNKAPATVTETKEFFYYGYAHNVTVDEYGNYEENNDPILYKGFRVKSTGRVSLYVVDGIDDGNLKLKINLADVEIAYYSYDGETWQNQQGSPTTLPFDFVWRKWKNEVGTFYCSGINSELYQTNCYIFGTKEESDDYNDGIDETGQGALNYGDVNPDAPFNPTGLEDDATTFGQVYTRAFFSQQYICSATALQEISNALFDTTQGGITGIFEDIKKGLEMYGENVIDAVQGCMFYPFDLNQVFTNTQNQGYIYFGGYKFDLQNATVNKIIYPNGFIDFGSVKIERTFNNYRDYAPYQRLYVYLPYIGWMELDINKYLDKTVNVKYFVDTRSGMTLCVLTANGVFTDYASGQLGVSIPMTLTDYSRFASAQIQTLCSGGKSALSQGGVGGSLGQGFTQGLIESGAVNPALLAGGGLVLGTALQGTKTLYGLTQNNINNFNKTIGNGSTSMLNEYLPQEVCFMFEIQDADITPNELSLQGYPSNASGTVGSFTGYLEVDTVNLICADATANEKAEIVNMLHSGVYI